MGAFLSPFPLSLVSKVVSLALSAISFGETLYVKVDERSRKGSKVRLGEQ